MKAIIKIDELRNTIATFKKANLAKQKLDVPALKAIGFIVDGMNVTLRVLKFTEVGTVAVKARIKGGEENGSLFVNMVELDKILTQIAKDKNVKHVAIEQDKDANVPYMLIKTGNITFRTECVHADDAPEIAEDPNFDNAQTFEPALVDMLVKAVVHASADAYRLNIMRVALCGRKDATLVVATDGHTLYKNKTPDVILNIAERENAMLEPDAVAVLNHSVSAHKKAIAGVDCRVLVTSHSIWFKVGNITIESRSKDGISAGSFPDFEQVLPRQSEWKIEVGRDDLLKAIGVASTVASNKTYNVRFSAKGDNLQVYASDSSTMSEVMVDVDSSYYGPEVKAGYNWKYVKRALDLMSNDRVLIEIIDTLSPTLLTTDDSADEIYVVMPMRL